MATGCGGCRLDNLPHTDCCANNIPFHTGKIPFYKRKILFYTDKIRFHTGAMSRKKTRRQWIACSLTKRIPFPPTRWHNRTHQSFSGSGRGDATDGPSTTAARTWSPSTAAMAAGSLASSGSVALISFAALSCSFPRGRRATSSTAGSASCLSCAYVQGICWCMKRMCCTSAHSDSPGGLIEGAAIGTRSGARRSRSGMLCSAGSKWT